MRKLRLLDLFCGAGGSAVGYHRAGFEVVGVDIDPQPRYPFPMEQWDALNVLDDLDLLIRNRFNAIHASPPCQAYTPLRARQNGKEYPDLVAVVREKLQATGLPYVIENVLQAPLVGGVILCGCMFGLRVYHRRRFESTVTMIQPPHGDHSRKTSTHKTKKHFDTGMNISVTGKPGAWVGPACMGIDWMNGGRELAESIPPAYTEWIGHRLMEHLNAR